MGRKRPAASLGGWIRWSRDATRRARERKSPKFRILFAQRVMPAPQPSVFTQAARLKFSSFGLKVPPNWRKPEGEAAEHYSMAFRPEDKVTTPGSTPGSPPLFQPVSLNRYHVDAQKMLMAKFGEFIDKMAESICNAIGTWMGAASMTGIIVNGITASGGQIVGPPLAPMIIAQAQNKTPMQLKFTTAIANVISQAWMSYTATIKIPGLPMFPSFLAVPLPMAPPTPNVPFPISALTQVPTSLTPALMKQQMVAALGNPTANFTNELFESLCHGFDQVIKVWQTSTMLTNVIGTGPVPTFAPPVVPAGPVVGGMANMPPGGLK
jgi:hypothetical protein